jgi:hypothetical protein
VHLGLLFLDELARLERKLAKDHRDAIDALEKRYP